MTTDYLLSNRWERERERLDALTGRYDPASLQLCEQLGLTSGWRVLEVGPGTGRFAQLLAGAVGSAGAVVAVDIDTSLAERCPDRAFELVKGDVRDGSLPDGPFDLVHARLVIGHLPDRPGALKQLIDRLRPGGWLVLEDFDRVTGTTCHPPSQTYERVAQAIWSVMAAGGFDSTFGRQLLRTLTDLGLEQVQVLGAVECIPGDSERGVPEWELLLDQLEPLVLASGAVSEEDLAEFRALLHDPAVSMLSPLLLRASGRR